MVVNNLAIIVSGDSNRPVEKNEPEKPAEPVLKNLSLPPRAEEEPTPPAMENDPLQLNGLDDDYFKDF